MHQKRNNREDMKKDAASNDAKLNIYLTSLSSPQQGLQYKIITGRYFIKCITLNQLCAEVAFFDSPER